MTRSLLEAQGSGPASCLLCPRPTIFEALNDKTLAAEWAKSVSAPVASVSEASAPVVVCRREGSVKDRRDVDAGRESIIAIVPF